MPNAKLTLIANDAGADSSQRDAGSGDFILEDPFIVGDNIDLSAQTLRLLGGHNPAAIFIPQSSEELFGNFLLTGEMGLPATFIFGISRLNVEADHIELIGGSSPGSFAALVSAGEFTVKAHTINLEAGTAPGANAVFLGLGGLGEFTFDSCTGCGDQLLFTDPFLTDTPTSGFFISGILQNPAVDAILSMLDRGNGDKDEEDDDEEDVKECGI
ncbi:MAG: hypothetical protein EXR86_11480 [Gammaproteobacteria bacterium]|nr:hypothetical protein [Gammaproteobacteria bacterium]